MSCDMTMLVFCHSFSFSDLSRGHLVRCGRALCLLAMPCSAAQWIAWEQEADAKLVAAYGYGWARDHGIKKERAPLYSVHNSSALQT